MFNWLRQLFATNTQGDDPDLASEQYRRAGPTELVEEGGVAMSGPGGSPAADEEGDADADRPDGGGGAEGGEDEPAAGADA